MPQLVRSKTSRDLSNAQRTRKRPAAQLGCEPLLSMACKRSRRRPKFADSLIKTRLEISEIMEKKLKNRLLAFLDGGPEQVLDRFGGMESCAFGRFSADIAIYLGLPSEDAPTEVDEPEGSELYKPFIRETAHVVPLLERAAESKRLLKCNIEWALLSLKKYPELARVLIRRLDRLCLPDLSLLHAQSGSLDLR